MAYENATTNKGDQGNLRVRCVSCPTIDVNITPHEVKSTPSTLSHTVQQNLMIDGNFHLNQYAKKSGDGVSLWGGRGYSPTEEELAASLEAVESNSNSTEVRNEIQPDPSHVLIRRYQKVECSYLKAVVHQNKMKFKNMNKSGLLCSICDHTVIVATVDLQRGERYALLVCET